MPYKMETEYSLFVNARCKGMATRYKYHSGSIGVDHGPTVASESQGGGQLVGVAKSTFSMQ